MRYSWLLTLAAILAVIIFQNALVPARSNLAALIKLDTVEAPVSVERNGRKVLVAKIYSTYPFNSHNFLTIAVGSADGVQTGMAVTADGTYLLGQITEVFEHYSYVRTIFDKNWQISVRIGKGQHDALLTGGQQPMLTMIDKSSVVVDGDQVVTASREFLYGMKLGQIAGLREQAGVSFQMGELAVPYSQNGLKEVAVIIR